MGLPSVGKTAMLNSLLPPTASRHTVAASVPPVASAKHPQPTTTAPVEVALDLGQGIMVHVIDTPGWEYAPDGDDEEAMDQQEEDDVEINESRWDKLEETITSDLLRRNLGRVDRVKDVFPLGQFIDFRLAFLLIADSKLHYQTIQCPRPHVGVQYPVLP